MKYTQYIANIEKGYTIMTSTKLQSIVLSAKHIQPDTLIYTHACIGPTHNVYKHAYNTHARTQSSHTRTHAHIHKQTTIQQKCMRLQLYFRVIYY